MKLGSLGSGATCKERELVSTFSKRREKPRVEACLHSRILMTSFLAQGVPARGFWRGGGGERADATVGPCVPPDTRPLWANICPCVSPRDHSGGRKPTGGCRSKPAGSGRVFLEF